MPIHLTPGYLRAPGFWAAYLARSLAASHAAEAPPELAARLFGLSISEHGAAQEALFGPWNQPTEWTDDPAATAEPIPYALLRLPLPGSFWWEIRFFGDDGPSTYHYLLEAADLPLAEAAGQPVPGLLLGYDDAHFHLPILRWPEVQALAAAVAQVLPAWPAEAVLLLLKPTAWLLPQELAAARAALEQAGAALGLLAGPAAPGELAAALTWAAEDLTWTPQPAGYWTTTAAHSHRQTGSWSAAQTARFAAALAAAGA